MRKAETRTPLLGSISRLLLFVKYLFSFQLRLFLSDFRLSLPQIEQAPRFPQENGGLVSTPATRLELEMPRRN